MEQQDDQQIAEDQHEYQESGGGTRYQTSHRQNIVERDGPSRSRAARGTGPDHGAPYAPAGTDTRPEHRDAPPTSPGPTTNDQITDDDQRVHPHPDDESWLKDLGYPKVDEHPESRATQVEHGPNAGGSQQGHPETAGTDSTPRRRPGTS